MTITESETDFTRKNLPPLLPNNAGPVQRAMAAGYAARRARLFGGGAMPPKPAAAVPEVVRKVLVVPAAPTWEYREVAPYDHHITVEQEAQLPVPAPTVRDIIRAACAKHNIAYRDIVSPSRRPHIVACRYEAAYELRRQILIRNRQISLPEIGRFLGGLDHTTVLYGIRKHAQRNGLDVPA